MIAIHDLHHLAAQRLREATLLYSAGEYVGAAYLCGYAVELTLKARICRTLNWNGYPHTRAQFDGFQSFKVHNLRTLSKLAGCVEILGTKYRDHWSNIEYWTPENRYRLPSSVPELEARRALAAASFLTRKL